MGAAVTGAAGEAFRPSEAPVERLAPRSIAGYRASALRVIDGDTFEARVSVFPGQEIVTRVRIAGVDAPERRGHCAAEKAAAQDSARTLAGLIDGKPLTLSDVRGDKHFGRVVARVWSAEATDVAQALIAAGAGRPYAGGRRAGWCRAG